MKKQGELERMMEGRQPRHVGERKKRWRDLVGGRGNGCEGPGGEETERFRGRQNRELGVTENEVHFREDKRPG